jgi:DNA polymerase-3 subunit alpha
MSHIGFSDPTGMFEAVAFSEVLAQSGDYLQPGQSVVLTAASRWEGDDLKLQLHMAKPLAAAASEASAGLRIAVAEAAAFRPLAERLAPHKGRGVVTLTLEVDDGAREVELELPGRFAVTPGLRRALKDVRGVLEVEEL